MEEKMLIDNNLKSYYEKIKTGQNCKNVSNITKNTLTNTAGENINFCANAPMRDIRYFSKILNEYSKNYKNAKFATKSHNKIIGYGANTNLGLVRNYNEDRVSIILNVIQPFSRKDEIWPLVSYFAIYDGHGGNTCSNFLKENLHHYIFREECFPSDPINAIYRGFAKAEKDFITDNKPVNLLNNYDRSGSCAIVIIIIGDDCYIANLGDSRALLSEEGGKNVRILTKDHKPNFIEEKDRIYSNGGYIFQGNHKFRNTSNYLMNSHHLSSNSIVEIPWRVFPGRLSVSRSFGDIEAKVPNLGGNPKVLSAIPDVFKVKIKDTTDFIILGSDGLFDKLSNQDIIKAVWISLDKNIIAEDIFQQCGRVVDIVMKYSLNLKTQDNITCLFICFNNFKKHFTDCYKTELFNILNTHVPNSSNYLTLQQENYPNSKIYRKEFSFYDISENTNQRYPTKEEDSIKASVSKALPMFKIDSQLYLYQSKSNPTKSDK